MWWEKFTLYRDLSTAEYRVENTTIHVTVLLQISLHYVRFHTRFALPMSMAAPLWRLVCKTKYIIFYFFRGHIGPLHKIQGYQGHRNVSKCSPHHNGDICTIRGNNLKTSFSYMSQNVKKKYILGYLGGPEGVFNDQTGPILLSSYPLTHIYVHVK